MPVARTKTFTGCWTCRSRKIKCSLERPVCKRCQKANLECEGYSIKLRWSTAKGDKEEEDFFQRRNVDFVEYPPDMIYETYDEMDTTLAKLHSPSLQGSETKSLGPFGVFDGIRKRSPDQRLTNKRKRGKAATKKSAATNKSEARRRSPLAPAHDVTKDPSANTNNASDMGVPLPNDNLEQILFADIEPGFNLFETNYQELRDELSTVLAADSNFTFNTDLFDQTVALPDTNTPATSTLTPAENTSTNIFSSTTLDMPSNVQQQQSLVAQNQQPATQQFTSTLFGSVEQAPVQRVLSVDNKFGLPTNSFYFTAESRYLLHHYTECVTRVMTVMVHDRNPWSTIYLPRAVAAIGDLAGKGSTPSAKNALLHALLSVSAYHLQAQYPEESEQKEYYAGLGLQLKGEAYKWLSECLTKDLAKQRYKDVITAVLSMVSIDVISGLMADCQVHLSACKSIVNMRCRMRPKVSNKAAALHRISGFLGIMQSSTALDPSAVNFDEKMFNDLWLNVRLEDFESRSPSVGSAGDVASSLSYMNEEAQFQEYWTRYQREGESTLSEDFYRKELLTTQSMYGVPDSLLLLFSRVCKVAQQSLYYHAQNAKFPKDLSKECADVEAGLVQWQTRYNINNKQNIFKGEARDALTHHSLAFHQSLIIYYFRLVRNLNPEILQANVSSVLDHLERIQEINRNAGSTVCIPLMFPGFMAACETTYEQPNLRSRFQQWLDQQLVEGIGTYITARRVINEVWQRRDYGRDRPDWWKVIYDWKTNLMLS